MTGEARGSENGTRSARAGDAERRVRQVFSFLRAFAEGRAPTVHTLDQVPHKLRLGELPEHPCIELGVVTLRGGVAPRLDERKREPRAALARAPPEPGEAAAAAGDPAGLGDARLGAGRRAGGGVAGAQAGGAGRGRQPDARGLRRRSGAPAGADRLEPGLEAVGGRRAPRAPGDARLRAALRAPRRRGTAGRAHRAGAGRRAPLVAHPAGQHRSPGALAAGGPGVRPRRAGVPGGRRRSPARAGRAPPAGGGHAHGREAERSAARAGGGRLPPAGPRGDQRLPAQAGDAPRAVGRAARGAGRGAVR